MEPDLDVFNSCTINTMKEELEVCLFNFMEDCLLGGGT
jgi:hypothetical protein